MEEFIDNVKILINTLGYKVLVPVPKASDDTIYLYCKSSSASAVILGHTSNGNVNWRTADGKKLKDSWH